MGLANRNISSASVLPDTKTFVGRPKFSHDQRKLLMRSGGFGFEHEKERQLPRTTHGPSVEEEEGTCIEKQLKRAPVLEERVERLPARVPVPVKCIGISCCLLCVFLVGLGAGIGIGSLI